MDHENADQIKYVIFDPTGNITALVETYTKPGDQPGIAQEIMERHPKVEQVGFIRYADNEAAYGSDADGAAESEYGLDEPISDEEVDAVLRMAGGEFCGNASMCAAVLYAMHRGLCRTGNETAVPGSDKTGASDKSVAVTLRVSGADAPVHVELSEENCGSFRTSVEMPAARSIYEKEFEYDGVSGSLPVVEMEGISHIIIESGSSFFGLKDRKADAEDAVRKWCGEISAKGLGLMFLDTSGRMTPLVYIPGADSLFWENSCASGSAAVGMYFASGLSGVSGDDKEPEVIKIIQPAGTLSVESISYGRIKLNGRVKFAE